MVSSMGRRLRGLDCRNCRCTRVAWYCAEHPRARLTVSLAPRIRSEKTRFGPGLSVGGAPHAIWNLERASHSPGRAHLRQPPNRAQTHVRHSSALRGDAIHRSRPPPCNHPAGSPARPANSRTLRHTRHHAGHGGNRPESGGAPLGANVRLDTGSTAHCGIRIFLLPMIL